MCQTHDSKDKTLQKTYIVPLKDSFWPQLKLKYNQYFKI